MNKNKGRVKDFFIKHKFEIMICLFCVAVAMLWESRQLLKEAKNGQYFEVNWNREMVEVMCDTNMESISFDENYAWLYVWLGSLDSRYDIYDQVILEDDDSITFYSSSLQLLKLQEKLKEKLKEIKKDYEKKFDRKVDISKDYSIISLSTESDYEYRLDDDYELRLIRLYVLALQSLKEGKKGDPWTLTITIRDKNTMEILQRIELPGNIERETETESEEGGKM